MRRIVKGQAARLRKLQADLAYQETMLAVDRRAVQAGRHAVKLLRSKLKRLQAGRQDP